MNRAGIIALPPRGLGFTIAIVVVLVMMHAISSMLLTEFGFAYEQPGGNPLTKIHPATLVAAALLLVSVLATGRPFVWLEQELAASKGATALTLMTILMMAHTALVIGLPFTGFIDTFLGPIHAYFLFKTARGGRARAMALAMHAFMVVNATIGIGEYVSGTRLIPFWVEGRILEGDWRSTALLGHPLANASIAGCYLITLALGGGRDIPPFARLFAFFLNALAMIAFGGRAASVLLVIVLAVAAALALLRILQGAPVSRLVVIGGVVATPVAVLALALAYDQGFFEQFVERFIDDQGSAQTRLDMFLLLSRFSFGELLFMPDVRLVETYQHMYGLEFGIESFWISFILQYGIIMSALLFAALFWFIRDVVRHSLPSTIYIMLFFFAVASTSVSLNGKGHQLSIVVAQALILLRRREAAVDVSAEPARRIAARVSTGRLAPAGRSRRLRLG